MMLGFDPASLESNSAEAAAALALRAAVISRIGINRFFGGRISEGRAPRKIKPIFRGVYLRV
jgi:hypothetical protein